ncbi:YraN family protein [Candidatus Fermentibacterales bacterium]|nr:YraN family protein [Candidatus Fermentibacterales bacterium]
MAGSDSRLARSRAAEAFVGASLERLGFTLLARNYRTRHGELDLVAIKEDLLVFVEVKLAGYRSSTLTLSKIDSRKKTRLSDSAAAFIAREQPAFETCRFDVAVVEETSPDPGELAMRLYLPGAFRPGGFYTV